MKYDHLLGRSFVHGARDCFSVCIEFFRDNFGIEITDYARPQDWSADNVDLIRTLHEREGFKTITDWKAADLRPADVLALAIGESNPNHLALYVGDNTMIHHLAGRFSTAEPYRDFWRNSTCFILRHPSVPDLRPVHQNTDIGSILRARHNRIQAA